MQYVELDTDATDCLGIDSFDDLLIHKRNECLKQYEAALVPELTKDFKLWFYTQNFIFEEEVEDLTRIYDKETNITSE
jgi:hypothetical protein